MPNASEPKAPWVAVCESPQTMVMPGSVMPCSGPITCTMPERVIQVIQRNAEFRAVLDQLLHLDTRHFAAGVDVFGLGRHVVVHGGEGFAGLAHLAAHGAQAVERLRRSDFVHR